MIVTMHDHDSAAPARALQHEADNVRMVSRRAFLALGGAVGATGLVVACGGPVAVVTPTAAPFVPIAPPAVGSLKDIPRNRTLVLAHGGLSGKFTESGLWNPFLLNAEPGLGVQLVCEPLAFYSALADTSTLWLAESYQYTADYLGLTIVTRSGVSWSDGQPFTADDVAWTLTELIRLGPKVRYGAEVKRIVLSVEATDSDTVKLSFRAPAPRFFDFLSYHADSGVAIMPRHIFEGKDLSRFAHVDVGRGWPVTTGPWRVVDSTPIQKVIDRAAEWWGVKAGIAELPKVERIIYLPEAGEAGLVQDLSDNKYDQVSPVRPSAFSAIFKGSPKTTTWTGQQPPFGYPDRSPHALYLNTQTGPTADREVRWALSYLLDRGQVANLAWSGAAASARSFLPDYPGLAPYIEGAKDLLARYDTLGYDPTRAAAILEGKGWRKGKDGIYLDARGQPFNLEIIGSVDFTTEGPAIVRQFKKGGIASSYGEPPNMLDRFRSGDYSAALSGHDGSQGSDPYDSLRLYQSSTARPELPKVNVSHWHNDEFDRLTDDLAMTSPTEKESMLRIWRQALELWLSELPELALVQGYVRLPTNRTYWTGWPDAANPYVGSAHYHLTAALLLHRLRPA